VTTHPLTLVFIVATLSGCAAALSPHSGWLGLLKNWIVVFVGLSVLMGLMAAFGRVVHDFVFTSN
jgi:hypothetical protein